MTVATQQPTCETWLFCNADPSLQLPFTGAVRLPLCCCKMLLAQKHVCTLFAQQSAPKQTYMCCSLCQCWNVLKGAHRILEVYTCSLTSSPREVLLARLTEASMTYGQILYRETVHSDTLSYCFNRMHYSDQTPGEDCGRRKELFLHPSCNSMMQHYKLAAVPQQHEAAQAKKPAAHSVESID